MKIRFTVRAVRDLSDISDYIRAENPKAAARVRESIEDSINLLADFPGLGKSQSGGVRKLITRKYNYRAYYAINSQNGEVVIITIRHPARAGLVVTSGSPG